MTGSADSSAEAAHPGLGTVHRAMGIETEYGVSAPGAPQLNPVLLSGRVVQAYAAGGHGRRHRARWDYAGESPLDDARGFSLSRANAHSSQLTDEWADDPAVANVVLANGARLYVDHAHPEYSSPEVRTPREALAWDRAGELVMAEAARCVAQAAREAREAGGAGAVAEAEIHLYKNNTDGKGASYGTHENYLLARAVPFEAVVAHLTPFFVARQVMCGAGRVGLGQDSREPGFQIASRADFVEAEVGLETTFRRPIINTRDEPHALREKYRRLHVIIGDANLCDVAGLLKLGTTSLVLGLVEAGWIDADLRLADPVAAVHTISHDPTLTARVRLLDGRAMSAIDLLWTYHDLAHAHVAQVAGGDPDHADPDTAEVLRRWATLLTDLGRDPDSCAGQVDWIAKRRLLQGYRDRDGLSWDDPRLAAIDLQWSDIRPGRGLARRLEARGSIERLVPEADVEHAVVHPPASTRAFFRGECLRRYPHEAVAASWESVLFDVPGHATLRRVGTAEPFRGTADLVTDLLDRHPDAASLLAELGR